MLLLRLIVRTDTPNKSALKTQNLSSETGGIVMPSFKTNEPRENINDMSGQSIKCPIFI